MFAGHIKVLGRPHVAQACSRQYQVAQKVFTHDLSKSDAKIIILLHTYTYTLYQTQKYITLDIAVLEILFVKLLEWNPPQVYA